MNPEEIGALARALIICQRALLQEPDSVEVRALVLDRLDSVHVALRVILTANGRLVS